MDRPGSLVRSPPLSALYGRVPLCCAPILMRPLAIATLLVPVLMPVLAGAEYRLTSDIVSVGAVDCTGGSFRLKASIGEPGTGIVAESPWLLQQGFWWVWRGTTGIPEIPDAVPASSFDLRLDQNAPNPFNPVTRISFVVPGETGAPVATRLDIIDVRGRLVCNLVDSPLPPGAHEVTWSGQSSDGRLVGSGVYFYHLSTGDQNATRRLVILK